MKQCLTQAPVLAYMDPSRLYELHVDASQEGFGGVLYQEHAELLCPVVFVSCSLFPAERN